MKAQFVSLIAALVAVLSASAAAGVTVKVSIPLNGATLESPVTVAAQATSQYPIIGWKIYVDSVLMYTAGKASSINTILPISAGAHKVVVRAWNSIGSYGSANLTINVIAPNAALSPSSLNFGSVTVGSASSVQLINVTNTGNAALKFTTGAVPTSGFQFGGTGTCTTGVSYAPGSSCTISLQFVPTASGTVTGNLIIYDNAPNSPQTASLTGTGAAATTPLAIASAAQIPNGTVGTAYSYQLAATGGTPPYTWSAPNGCTIGGTTCNATTGLISGTPTTVGTYSWTVQVTDSKGATAQTVLAWLVNAGTTSSTGSGTINCTTTVSTTAELNSAGASASPGSVICVSPGTYGAVTTSVSGTSSARIRFISTTRWGAKINTTAYTAWKNTGDYVDIVGFDVSNTGCTGIENDGSYSRVLGNHVHDVVANVATTCGSNGGSGISIGGNNLNGSDNDTIGNFVHDIGWPTGANQTVQGIYHSNLRGHIENNIVIHSAAWGICLYHAPSNVVVANNTVINNGTGGILIDSAGESPNPVNDYTTVVNNIAAYNQAGGGSNAGWGIQERDPYEGSHNVFNNNLTYGNATGGIQLIPNGGTISSTVTGNPLFVNYTGDSTGDYHLQSGSPAINSGAVTNAPTNDFSGGTRPISGNWDIGAYEYGAPPAAWPWF